MKRYKVFISQEARNDLAYIKGYIVREYDDSVSANKLILRLLDKCFNLTYLPVRSSIICQVKGRKLRSIHIKGYRIIYYIDEAEARVFILAVVGSRRSIDRIISERG